ncbi:MAG: hypothetical protein ACR2NA_01780 [Solirubrobacterales bacterium]
MAEHHTKKVTLPSGKTIEVVYFDQEAGTELPSGGLQVCPSCGCDLVQPLAWEEADARKWTVSLRCPGCDWEGGGTYSHEAIEAFDAALDAGTEAMVDDLRRLMRANMVEDVERFCAALRHDVVLPEDF